MNIRELMDFAQACQRGYRRQFGGMVEIPSVSVGRDAQFWPGKILATTWSLEVIRKAGIAPQDLLARHLRGDRGHDAEYAENNRFYEGARESWASSSYMIHGGEEICIVTTGDLTFTRDDYPCTTVICVKDEM